MKISFIESNRSPPSLGDFIISVHSSNRLRLNALIDWFVRRANISQETHFFLKQLPCILCKLMKMAGSVSVAHFIFMHRRAKWNVGEFFLPRKVWSVIECRFIPVFHPGRMFYLFIYLLGVLRDWNNSFPRVVIYRDSAACSIVPRCGIPAVLKRPQLCCNVFLEMWRNVSFWYFDINVRFCRIQLPINVQKR
jgi:hypothetical protein